MREVPVFFRRQRIVRSIRALRERALKRRVLLFAVFAAIAGGLMLPALADEKTVNATVTAVLISVSVNPTAVSYGTLPVGTTNATPTPGSFTATNTGNVNENFSLRGASTANWALGPTAGANTYVHRFGTSSGAVNTALSGSNQAVLAGVVPSGNGDIFLKMDLPTSSTFSSQQTAAVIVVATQ
jgi:hypothetical protein